MKSLTTQSNNTVVTPTGRPPLFVNKKVLERRIAKYWSHCGITEMAFIKGKKVKNIPTINGLALWLGTNRQTLSNYEKREEFFYTIKRAKQVIEAFNELMLVSGEVNPKIIIFNLKNNFGWKDKVETKNSPFDIDINDLYTDISFIFADKKN